jgi:glycosyltransferase involved in cell wall biosynthesis
VWIDGLAFESTHQRGIWRVFYELINRTNDRVRYTIWLQNEPALPLPKAARVVRSEGRRELSPFQFCRRLERRWLRKNDPKELANADVFHSTGFTWPKRGSLPIALTLCDMIAESHFSICTREVQETLPVKRDALYRATGLLCISQSTLNELVAFYPDLQPKAKVIHLGAGPILPDGNENCVAVGHEVISHVSKSHPAATIQDRNPHAKEAVYVGQRAGYKNFGLILQAMTLATWPTYVHLIVVGQEFNFGEQLLIRRYGLDDRIQHAGTLSDSALTDLYSRAHCLLFPSLQEGFGLPCLEAQISGCPLLCSDIPVFREVAGDAAIFFDPRMPQSLARAVKSLDTLNVKEELLIAGRNNTKRFRWGTFANEVVSWYHQLLKSPAKS